MNSLLNQAKPIIYLFVGCGLLTAAMVWIVNGGLTSLGEDNAASVSEIEIDEDVPLLLNPEELAAYDVEVTNDSNPIAVMSTNYGTIELELFENVMPITAGNFAKLAEEGFYDGTKFHRVMNGFMIQGGDPLTKTDQILRYGTGGPGYTIADEHIKADLLTNVRGTISMANSGPESGGSQFFINLVDNQNLDFDRPPTSSKHPVFGRVISGMDVVDAIGAVDVNDTALPREDVLVENVVIRRSN